MDHWILSYKSPAEAWNEALPLGNGTLGVMSYGRLENETLELNLDTLWSGDGSSKLNKNGHADLGHLRKLLKDQKHPEAEDYCRKHILGDWTDSYLPAQYESADVRTGPRRICTPALFEPCGGNSGICRV